MFQFVRLFRPLMDREFTSRGVLAATGSVFVAVLEAVGLLVLYPLVQLLITPSGNTLPASARWFAQHLNHPSQTTLAGYLAAIAFGAFVLKGIVSMLLLRSIFGFILRSESEMSRRLLGAYLRAPYVFHLRRNSAELQRTVHDDVRRIYEDSLVALVGGAADVVVLLAIGLVLFAIKPLLALCAALYFILVAFGYQRLIHGRARHAGDMIHNEVVGAYRIVQQSVGAIKEVQLRQRAEYFTSALFDAKQRTASRLRTILLLYHAPRYFLETAMIFGVAVMALVTYHLLPAAEATATLSLFVAAGFRVLPSLNRVLVSLSAIKAGIPALEHVRADLMALETVVRAPGDASGSETPLSPTSIKIENISFRYDADGPEVLRNLSLRADPGECIAVVGVSGAGKSTLLDLLLGLLTPTHGHITLGGTPLNDVLVRWQRSIGYVPQEVVLLDDSVRANIAFGDPSQEIDNERVRAAADLAQLTSLLEDLPDGINTGVDERGVRLSGGQRQRVGLARALYHRPCVLILDEATSALDAETERRITDTIEGLRGALTIIIVTHRLSLVKGCDRIYLLEGGTISSTGTFEDLLGSSILFRDLARMSPIPDRSRDARVTAIAPSTASPSSPDD